MHRVTRGLIRLFVVLPVGWIIVVACWCWQDVHDFAVAACGDTGSRILPLAIGIDPADGAAYQAPAVREKAQSMARAARESGNHLYDDLVWCPSLTVRPAWSAVAFAILVPVIVLWLGFAAVLWIVAGFARRDDRRHG
jgi:hypothetical protein